MSCDICKNTAKYQFVISQSSQSYCEDCVEKLLIQTISLALENEVLNNRIKHKIKRIKGLIWTVEKPSNLDFEIGEKVKIVAGTTGGIGKTGKILSFVKEKQEDVLPGMLPPQLEAQLAKVANEQVLLEIETDDRMLYTKYPSSVQKLYV